MKQIQKKTLKENENAEKMHFSALTVEKKCRLLNFS